MTPEDRRTFVKEELEGFRADARDQLKQMFPELNAVAGAPPPPPGFVVQ